jgi:hypothetical protein
MRRVIIGLAAAALAVGAAACDEQLSDVTGPTPNLEPTFTSIQQEIFSSSDSSGRAACVQCHNNLAPAGLNLLEGQAYANLVNRASTQRPDVLRVNPGDSDNSYLIHKLEGQTSIVGQRMPRTSGPFLTDGQIRVIRRWIELGAPNN